MGQMTDAKTAAWQDAAGIKPATGDRVERLQELSQAAYRLIKIIELESAGIRDGNGYWHGSDPLHGTASSLWGAYQDLESLDTCPRCGAGEQATHHSACQRRDGTPTSLTDKQVREVLDGEQQTPAIPF